MLFTGAKLVFCSFVLCIAVVTVSVGRSVAQTKKKFVFFKSFSCTAAFCVFKLFSALLDNRLDSWYSFLKFKLMFFT